MSERRTVAAAVFVLILAAFVISCSTDDDNDVTPVDIPAESMSTIVLAWSDTGMQHINATYGAEVFLPPYNGLRAQVIRRGDPPEIVTTGITLEYRLVDNTSSYGKTTADPVRDYSRFWDDSLDLFGVSLLPDTGLNFVDPGVHNGLSGTMLLKGDHFQVDGIPAVPINDAGTWDPYQVAEITVRDASTHDVLARTRATIRPSSKMAFPSSAPTATATRPWDRPERGLRSSICPGPSTASTPTSRASPATPATPERRRSSTGARPTPPRTGTAPTATVR
ncbi:MAG: hypothetical protein H6P96_1323 [Candidatus Aminicenantes bacterium]|nr:hypothetical protein [Candidatus Aminicenantes bacterium]